MSFQTAELGKVDGEAAGPSPISLAKYGMDAIDSGVAVLSMQLRGRSPARRDIYEASLGYTPRRS